jgi:hypothetical protein
MESINVFFPAYNDASSLPALLEKTFTVRQSHFYDYEVIAVNDGDGQNKPERSDPWMELSGWQVEEIGVHHYPRLHGRSQFLRLRIQLSFRAARTTAHGIIQKCLSL